MKKSDLASNVNLVELIMKILNSTPKEIKDWEDYQEQQIKRKKLRVVK